MKPTTLRVMDGLRQGVDSTFDFDALVEFYRPRIFRFALASLRDRDAAETIAQDCFVRAHFAYPQFRGDCSIQTWLMGIAANLVRDHERSRKLRFWKKTSQTSLSESALNAGAFCSSSASPEGMAIAKQRIEAVWNAAAQLSGRQRTVFFLRFVEDMNILEIAAALGITEGSVKTHLHRALQALRLMMELTK